MWSLTKKIINKNNKLIINYKITCLGGIKLF